jgi:hypothetical protein
MSIPLLLIPTQACPAEHQKGTEKGTESGIEKEIEIEIEIEEETDHTYINPVRLHENMNLNMVKSGPLLQGENGNMNVIRGYLRPLVVLRGGVDHRLRDVGLARERGAGLSPETGIGRLW